MSQYDSDDFKVGKEQIQGVVLLESESWSGQVQLFTEDGDNFYVYHMNGNRVPVEWKEFGYSVQPIYYQEV